MINKVVFKQIDDNLANQLIAFCYKKNLNKTITIENVEYTLDYLKVDSSAFFKSRSFSAYFKVGRSIIRISDHWAKSKFKDKSQKMNCISVSGKSWSINNKTKDTLSVFQFAGKYPFQVFAGIASLSKLNKDCDHWNKKA